MRLAVPGTVGAMSNPYVNEPAKLRIGAGTAFKFGFFGALGLFVFYLLVSVVFGIIAAVVLAAVAAAEEDLGRSGRVLLRPSGTESLVRVMIEAETYEVANEIATRLADVVKSSLSL